MGSRTPVRDTNDCVSSWEVSCESSWLVISVVSDESCVFSSRAPCVSSELSSTEW